MPQTARRAAVAALTALAALAAIIAADFTAPAQAQSEDETTGRIVARRLDDGRVEFGWQPAGGARVLPRQRYFPTDATVDRWLRSSPVEVGGAEIGRINARLLSDGRIEFAFTPTDREWITPQARYFPANARANRWLRSTKITIGSPAPRYTAVNVGLWHTCAIRESEEIECWGSSEGDRYYGQANPPPGNFIAVSAGNWHTCAIRTSGEIECWGKTSEYTHYSDALTEPQTIEIEQADPPPGSYTAVSAGQWHTCGLRTSGEIKCWGLKGIPYLEAGMLVETSDDRRTSAPDGRFRAVSAGGFHTCGLRENGAIECWGRNDFGQTNAPEGRFTAVNANRTRTCGLRDTGEIECWGAEHGGEGTTPTG